MREKPLKDDVAERTLALGEEEPAAEIVNVSESLALSNLETLHDGDGVAEAKPEAGPLAEAEESSEIENEGEGVEREMLPATEALAEDDDDEEPMCDGKALALTVDDMLACN